MPHPRCTFCLLSSGTRNRHDSTRLRVGRRNVGCPWFLSLKLFRGVVCVILCQGAACRSSPDVPRWKTPTRWGDDDVSIG
jgi:hypothetical protein